ncbi:hypothetical protein C8R44DRAFT_665016 [Mycena epipterygia]|nr:hypothetical protein C8R44DRAFT_665016 [Mycena epipterygia]
MEALRTSLSAMGSDLRIGRLFREDAGVEGCGLFHKRREKPFHLLGNILRLVFAIIFSPIYLLTPRTVVEAIDNYVQAGWLLEFANTHDSVLSNARGGGKGRYDVTGEKPSWLLKVTIKNGTLHHARQIRFSEEFDPAQAVKYTALSYPMQSAAVLFTEAGLRPSTPPPGDDRQYTLADRKNISAELLRLYCSANRSEGEGNPDRTEYIWLDEFCLSDDSVDGDDNVVNAQRSKELGRLADIFRGAVQVAVFCDKENCDHTDLKCIWGQRLFTIPEIIHAQAVLRLVRKRKGDNMVTWIFPISAPDFRQAMQRHAAQGNRWHLYAIFQHTVNAGAVPWQVAIHALVVEAIRRDDIEPDKFYTHKYLGKALNGLLPRRARLDDLGSSGWNDLAWLLELNQGFYNAASLAAVCSIAEDPTMSWLGKPIDPAAGNERLEPVVTAFPVCLIPDKKKKGSQPTAVRPNSDSSPPLTIIGGETLGFRPRALKRDAAGLYNNEEMKGLKVLSFWVAAALVIISVILLSSQNFAGFVLFYVTAILYCIVELLTGTMYLDREGWVFLEDSQWGDRFEDKLGDQDSNLRTLTHWGDRQLIPQWEAPNPKRRPCFSGKLVDLRSKVYVETVVVSKPNAMVPLAIHGSGVTCMLLDRSGDAKNDPTFSARKVGMCNVPPYIFAQTTKSGTICISP